MKDTIPSNTFILFHLLLPKNEYQIYSFYCNMPGLLFLTHQALYHLNDHLKAQYETQQGQLTPSVEKYYHHHPGLGQWR